MTLLHIITSEDPPRRRVFVGIAPKIAVDDAAALTAMGVQPQTLSDLIVGL